MHSLPATLPVMERLVRAAPTARGYPADMAKVGSWLLNWVRQPEPIRATRQAGKIQPGTVEGPAAALTVAAGRPAGCAERPSGEMESSTRLGMMMSAPPMQAVTTAAMRQPRAAMTALPPYRKNSREVTPTAAAEARERMV